MAISEKSIREGIRSIASPPEEGPITSDDFPRNFYLVSSEYEAEAWLMADASGISRSDVVFVPLGQPLRAKVIFNFKGLHRDQLLGDFSQTEINFLIVE